MNNPNPVVHKPSEREESNVTDPFITEIFDLIRDIKDPEHPHTLEELNVVSEECITLQYRTSTPAGDHVLSTTGPSHQGGSISSQGALTSSQGASTSTGNSTEGASITSQQRGEQACSSADNSDMVWIKIEFNPTVPHCSLATLIGLCLRIKLERCLGQRHKLDISVAEGSHSVEKDVNKQINDKERVAAAMENPHLREMVEQCIRELQY